MQFMRRLIFMNNPLISVIVPCYNRKEWISATINSLLQQTYGNFEAIFINDGGEPIDDILDKYNDPRFKYFEHDKNKGLPAARNTGLKNSKGDYISLLDSDDIYMPLALEFRLAMMIKYRAEIVYTRALQNIYELENGKYSLKHQQLYWNSSFHRDSILISNICPCNCVLFSRKAWEQSEYWFDENLDSSEDFDFWIALSRKNDFIDLRLIDCEDSYRTNGDQMTGTRNFLNAYPVIYKRWRHTATEENMTYVVENQNNILLGGGLNPEDYGL